MGSRGQLLGNGSRVVSRGSVEKPRTIKGLPDPRSKSSTPGASTIICTNAT
jgi:hypothetical protein